MSQTFILQNQDKLFFGKSKEWVDGYDANSLFKTAFKDEAINQMVEISSEDYKQRVKVLTCDLNEKGLPILDPEIMPAPLPKVPKGPKATDDLFAESSETSEAETETKTEGTQSTDATAEVDSEADEIEELEFITDSEVPEQDNNQQAALL